MKPAIARTAPPLQWVIQAEDGGDVSRLRCPECGWTHWNNPTPVLAAIVELDGKVLLARNAAWPEKVFGLITGFMEAGESPEEGVAREVAEETGLKAESLELISVHEFLRMNQVIIAFHVRASGQVRLSPELLEYRLLEPEKVQAWPSGTGMALAAAAQPGHDPVIRDFWKRAEQAQEAEASRADQDTAAGLSRDAA